MTTLSQPLVSIITVVYNGEDYLESTINSVFNQSYPHIEYIIIDGASTDKTLDIIHHYSDRLDYWISEPDHGIYDAMNKGISVAKGELIGLINCGDSYTPDAVSEVVKLYQQSLTESPYQVITGAMYRFDAEKDLKFKISKDQATLDSRINRGMPINHPATFVSRATYQKLGLFKTNYRICGDYDLIFRLYHSPLVKFKFTDTVLAYMSLGGISERLSSVGIRCREHFQIRNSQLSKLHNFYLATTWYVRTTTKFMLKKIISNSIMSRYYELKHE